MFDSVSVAEFLVGVASGLSLVIAAIVNGAKERLKFAAIALAGFAAAASDFVN